MAEHPESSIGLEHLISVLAKTVTTEGPPRRALFDLPAEKVTALERDVATVLLTIRSAVNQTVPINRLPPEILAKVLEFRENDKDLISATHVCNRWRSTLTSAPPLWTKAVFRDPSCALAYITRSGALPIDVSFTTTPLSFEACDFVPEDYYTSRIPWFDRVQSMILGGDEEEIEAIFGRLCLPAPLLESVKLDGKPNQTLTPWRTPAAVRLPREFLGGQAPSLRDLSLNSISPVLVAKLPLTNLTSLTWIDNNSAAMVGDLLPVLASAPSLEILTLELRVQSVSAAERTTVVSLNRLVELTWFNFAGTFSLTSCLITPELRSLVLDLVPDVEAQQTDLASILPPREGHFPLLIEPTKAEYSTWRGTRSCQFQSARGHIFLTASHGNYDEVHTPWFLRNAAIPFKQIKEMTIEVEFPPLREFPTERFEGLETLELMDGGNEYFTLVQPYFRGSALVVPFPALLEVQITFSSTISLAGLAGILEQRKQAGYEVKTVRIQGECDGTMAINEAVAKIRESVGKVALEIAHYKPVGCAGHQLGL